MKNDFYPLSATNRLPNVQKQVLFERLFAGAKSALSGLLRRLEIYSIFRIHCISEFPNMELIRRMRERACWSNEVEYSGQLHHIR